MTQLQQQPVGEEFFQRTHEYLAHLRDQQPVSPVIMPNGLRVWLVTRYEDARALLADARLFKDLQRSGDVLERNFSAHTRRTDFPAAIARHMLNADPPEHTRLRKLVNRAFTPRRITAMRPRLEAVAEQLATQLKQRGAGETSAGEGVDLMEHFAFPFPITVICELLGVPEQRRAEFREWSNAVVASSAQPAAAEQASAAMSTFLSELIDSKRADPGDDLLSDLVRSSEDSDQLTHNELLSMAFLLLVAGHETTVNLIGNGMLALLQHPEQLARLRAEPDLLPAAVEELLRYDSPLTTATMRFTSTDIPLDSTVIPAESVVLVSLSSAGRDEQSFPEPDRVELGRRTSGHLTFGHGIHYCLGAPLARLEGELAFSALLRHFSGIELAVPAERLRWRQSMLMHGLEELPLLLTSAAPA